MLRQPGSRYEAGRSHTLLKVKSFKDDKARVVGHVAGVGRHKDRLGALEVELGGRHPLLRGTGFSDAACREPAVTRYAHPTSTAPQHREGLGPITPFRV
jgi:DNA ligase-1